MSVSKGASKKKKSEEPYLFKDEKANVKVKMEFQGHYNEKPLEIEFSRDTDYMLYKCSCNPHTGEWEEVEP